MGNTIAISALFLALFIPASELSASTKGCVSVFEDGSRTCSPMQFGGQCELRPGQRVLINGKPVVRRIQVSRCEGYDGLGRRTSPKAGSVPDWSNMPGCDNDYDFCMDRVCIPRCDFNRDGRIIDEEVDCVMACVPE